jgi:hypothetical protein
MKKYLIVTFVLAVLGAAGYWYADYRGWINRYGPDNLPTAEERQRMAEIEKTSATIAPNAVPGAGVRPKGSLPPTPPPTPTATTSSTSLPIEATSTATTS